MYNYEAKSHKSLRESVYEELKENIITGATPPGTRMMEVEIAEEMGVSRTPVREAVRKLAEEGLIEIIPRRGSYVSEVSIKDMVDVLEVRRTLEGKAAALAASKITEEDAKHLRKAAANYRKVVEKGDAVETIKRDAAFHKLVAICSGNKTLAAMTFQAQDLAQRFRNIYYKDMTRYQNMPDEHDMIVEAIIAGDANEARDLMKKHLERLRVYITTQMPQK